MKTETPFRFVGGKTRLFPNIVKYLPNPEEVNNYFEPFCGGGAIFFLYGWKCGRAYLNDVNKPLMYAYHKLAHGHYDKIEGHLHDLLESTYDEIRDEFNELHLLANKPLEEGSSDTLPVSLCDVRYAALFIALNHLCFNGVWRENKKGNFNVPIGKTGTGVKAKPRVLTSLDFDKLMEAAERLQTSKAMISSASFDPWPFPAEPEKGDVVFYDSPYISEFSQYNKDGFTVEMHKRLNEQARGWAASGARVILCMSNNEAARAIYGAPTEIVLLARTVGHSQRKTATEALYVW